MVSKKFVSGKISNRSVRILYVPTKTNCVKVVRHGLQETCYTISLCIYHIPVRGSLRRLPIHRVSEGLFVAEKDHVGAKEYVPLRLRKTGDIGIQKFNEVFTNSVVINYSLVQWSQARR